MQTKTRLLSSRGRHSLFVMGAVGSAAIAALCGPIHAQTVNWTNGAGNLLWTDTLNWDLGVLPGATDTAVMAANPGGTVSLGGTPQTIETLLFNQTSGYSLTNGALIVNNTNQTGNVQNNVQVTVTTKNGGADILNANVTTNSLQLQQKVTSGGIIKTGAGLLRLGTSGTNFDNAINGEILINGGTLQASAATPTTPQVNNPLAGTGAGSDRVRIAASGVTFSMTHSNLAAAGAAGTYDFARNVLADNFSFTLNADRAAGSANSGTSQFGTVTIGTATLTTTGGNGFNLRSDGLIINPGATTTINAGVLLQFDSLQGDASSKISKTGGSELRIASNASNATTFAGDIDLNQGTLTLINDGAQPLGNAQTTINIVSATNTPTISLRAPAAATFDNINVNAGNNNFNFDVRPNTGTTGGTMTAGIVTIGTATMNVNGDRHNLRLAEVQVAANSTATLNVNSATNGAQNLRVDKVTADATTTLRKAGGQTLTIGGASVIDGKIELNGGTTTIESSGANAPTANSTGLLFASGGNTLNLRSDVDSNYGFDVSFAPEVFNQTISIDRLTAAGGTGKVFALGEINLSGGKNLTLNQGNSFAATLDAIRVNSGTGTLTSNASITTPIFAIAVGTTFNKVGSGGITLTQDNSAISFAPINLREGTITASVTGALGSGLVTVGNATPNTAGFYTPFSRLNWNAAGASANATGVDAIAVHGGVIDLNVVPNTTDVFDIKAEGRIQGTTAQLQGLTIGTNLTVAPNAIIVHENPSDVAGTSVIGLQNNADLFYGIAATANSLPVIGAGTPWKGISGDNAARLIQGATISINGGDNNVSTVEAYLQSMSDQTLSLGTAAGGDAAYQFASTAAGGAKVTLGIRGVLGVSGLGLVPGGRVAFYDDATTTGLNTAVDKIIVDSGSLLLLGLNTLGGVPVEVRNNGSVDINNLAGNLIDGDITFKQGGVLYLNDNQLLGGSGIITIEQGGKLDMAGSAPADLLTASTQKINFTGSGHTIRFAANEIGDLDVLVPNQNVTYLVQGGAAAATAPSTTNLTVTMNTQTAGLTLDNGTLTNDGGNRGFTGALNLNNSNLTVAASRGTSFVVASDIATTGNLQIGSLTAIDGRDKSTNSGALNWANKPDPFNSAAQVILTGAVTAGNVTVNNSNFYLTNGASQFTGDINLTGGVLYLDGGGNTGGTLGELTSKIAAGTLADEIITNGYTRIEMKLNLASDSNATVLNIDQKFVINSLVNPQDNRSMWVSRNSGSNTRVNFNNILLNEGAELAFDEDNTDIRAAITLGGNATIFTGGHDNFDYLSLTRAASVTTPVKVTLGKVNETGIQGFNNHVANFFGELGAGVEVDIVRGQLLFVNGSSINGIVRTQTAAVGGDSFVRSSSGSTSNTFNTDTTIGGTGRIELGRGAFGAEDFEVAGTEVTNATASQAPLHTHAGEIRVINDGTSAIDGVIRANRLNDSERTARVQVDNVQLTDGAGVQLTSSNAIPLTVDKITLQGAAGTVETAVAGVTINTIQGGNNLTLTGAGTPNIGSGLTAAQVNIIDGNANVAGGVTGALTVTRGNANLTGNVTAGLAINQGGVTFNPGDGVTGTVGGPVSLDAGSVAVASGTLDFGTTVLTSTPSFTVAGLREMKITGASFDEVTANSSSTVKLGPVMGQSTTGWGSNETYVYTGQIFVPDNDVAGDGMGSFALAENFDDNVRIDIDGVQRLRNTTWNDATGTGVLTLAAGWHDFEVRLGQGGGGAGPNANDGWDATLGLGIDLTVPIDPSTGSPIRANFLAPLDSGTMDLFRTEVGSNVSIAGGATFKAGGFTNLNALRFSGFAATANIAASGAAQANTTDAIFVSSNSTGALNIVRSTDTVTAGELNLEGTLTKSGAGTLIVNGQGTGASDVMVEGGKFIMNGSISGAVTLNPGVEFGGNGSVGPLNAIGGTVSPGHLGSGILSTGDLTLGAGTLAIELGGAGPGQSDQLNVTGSVSLFANTTLTLAVNFTPQVGQSFTIINNNGTDLIDLGSFRFVYNNTTLNEGALLNTPDGAQFRLSYAGGIDANDVVLTTTIPEPTTAMSLIGGLGGLLGLQRFRRRK